MYLPTVLSLFSGCGGLDLGFSLSGFEIKLAIDHWSGAVDIHKKNRDLIGGECIQKSLKLSDNEINLSELPKVDVILGGPPCQGFSFAGKQMVDDPRNRLYLDFKAIVEHLKPKVFLMENVRGLEKMALSAIQESFNEIGYDVNVNRVEAIKLGIPQRRERVIIVGTKTGTPKFKTPDILLGGLFAPSIDVRTVMDAISDLPQPDAAKNAIDSTSFLDDHVFYPLSVVEQNFIRHIPNSGYYADAPRSSLPDRLKKIYDEPLKYKSPRLFPKADPLRPSQTVPASSSPSIGGVIAPDLDYTANKVLPIDKAEHTVDGVYTAPNGSRRFTPREMARLQTFPDQFLFTGSPTSKIKAIGNAVPVELARVFAAEIHDQFFS